MKWVIIFIKLLRNAYLLCHSETVYNISRSARKVYKMLTLSLSSNNLCFLNFSFRWKYCVSINVTSIAMCLMFMPFSSLVLVITFCSSLDWGIWKIVHAYDLQKTNTDIAIPDKSQIFSLQIFVIWQDVSKVDVWVCNCTFKLDTLSLKGSNFFMPQLFWITVYNFQLLTIVEII